MLPLRISFAQSREGGSCTSFFSFAPPLAPAPSTDSSSVTAETEAGNDGGVGILFAAVFFDLPLLVIRLLN